MVNWSHRKILAKGFSMSKLVDCRNFGKVSNRMAHLWLGLVGVFVEVWALFVATLR